MTDPTPSLRDLFEVALTLPLAERAGYLDRQCRDASHRAVVRDMLEADEDSSTRVLDQPIDDLLDRVGEIDPVASAPLPAGSRIGAFTVQDVLGEGGSSIVFRAVREQAGVQQVVALKLLRRGLYSDDERRRFRSERRALAQLRHPGIARLIEGGVTDAGVPYIALELVDGEPITDYARSAGLGLEPRLHLMIAVCRAVEAAHRALIVHRDLKPSNVLVNRDGEVKLLDFGIAKLLGGEEGDDATRTQHHAMTPAYAAPEQFEHGLITTATDVYALGVLLGELVTGKRRERGDPRASSTPSGPPTSGAARPSPTLPPAGKVRGDLDNIVGKAIDADPERRYTSAGSLADDLQRLLDGLPVSAHPPSRAYRARKFVARHRGVVAGTALFVVSVIAALGVAVWQANLARQEARRANAVRDFVESMFEPLRAGVAQGKQPTLAELVGKGADRIDGTAALDWAERVDLLLMFARLQDYLSDTAQYQALADRAGELADARLGPNDPLALDALVARGIAALRRSDYALAGARLREAERRLRAAGTRGDAWIRLLGGLGQWATDTGDPERALDYAQQGLDARLSLFAADSAEATGGYTNLASAFEGVGRFRDAIDIYRRMQPVYALRFGADSERTWSVRGRLGQAELMVGDVRAAREDLRATMDALSAPEGRASALQMKLVQSLCLAEVIAAPATAVDTCSRAVVLAEKVEGKDGANVGRALHVEAVMRIERGELRLARALLQRSRDLLAAAHRPNWQGRAEIALGEIALIEGDVRGAVDALSSGIAHVGASYPPYLGVHGRALLALACSGADPPATCPGTSDEAAAALAAQAAPWNPLLLPAHVALARIDIGASRVPAAVRRLDSAIGYAEAQTGPSNPRLLDARLWRLLADVRAGSCPAAIAAADDLRAAIQGQIDHPLLQAAIGELRAATTCDARFARFPH